MNKFYLILILNLSIMSNAIAQSTQNVDAETFLKLTQSGNGVILDVRTSGEYSRGHIEGSTLISTSDRQFVSKVNLLQKDKPVYLYCLTGSRSYAAANYLVKSGFTQVYNLQRGIMEWNQKGYPTVKQEKVVASKSIQYSTESFNKMINSNNLVLVDFHAVWCAPCKQMMPTIEKISSTYKGKALVEKVDVEANKDLTEAYKIQSIPGFILFKDGKEVWKHKGVISYEALKETLDSYL